MRREDSWPGFRLTRKDDQQESHKEDGKKKIGGSKSLGSLQLPSGLYQRRVYEGSSTAANVVFDISKSFVPLLSMKSGGSAPALENKGPLQQGPRKLGFFLRYIGLLHTSLTIMSPSLKSAKPGIRQLRRHGCFSPRRDLTGTKRIVEAYCPSRKPMTL